MLDVAFTAAQARPAAVTVVIDVLRATSTIVQALDAGYCRVLCAPDLEHARGLAGPDRVLAGERHCVRPPGFDLGNSPAQTLPPRGRELVLATTNGAPAIVRAAELSEVVLIAALLNLDAVVAALAGVEDLQLLCSGTDGRPALEDAYAAGRIADRLAGEHSDSARICLAVASTYPDARGALAASADALVLVREGLGDDIEWCARESTVDLAPRAHGLHDGTAAVDRSSSID